MTKEIIQGIVGGLIIIVIFVTIGSFLGASISHPADDGASDVEVSEAENA